MDKITAFDYLLVALIGILSFIVFTYRSSISTIEQEVIYLKSEVSKYKEAFSYNVDASKHHGSKIDLISGNVSPCESNMCIYFVSTFRVCKNCFDDELAMLIRFGENFQEDKLKISAVLGIENASDLKLLSEYKIKYNNSIQIDTVNLSEINSFISIYYNGTNFHENPFFVLTNNENTILSIFKVPKYESEQLAMWLNSISQNF